MMGADVKPISFKKEEEDKDPEYDKLVEKKMKAAIEERVKNGRFNNKNNG